MHDCLCLMIENADWMTNHLWWGHGSVTIPKILKLDEIGLGWQRRSHKVALQISRYSEFTCTSYGHKKMIGIDGLVVITWSSTRENLPFAWSHGIWSVGLVTKIARSHLHVCSDKILILPQYGFGPKFHGFASSQIGDYPSSTSSRDWSGFYLVTASLVNSLSFVSCLVMASFVPCLIMVSNQP